MLQGLVCELIRPGPQRPRADAAVQYSAGGRTAQPMAPSQRASMSASADAPVTLDQIREARRLVARRVHRTPVLTSSTAARIAAYAGRPVGGGRVFVKAEHLQVTGSFKPRGMTWRVATLTPEERAGGIITISAGNAAQAYAWAARAAGVHAVVAMPVDAVPSKVEACLGYGAEVVRHGTHVGETLVRVEELRAERGLFFAHPFDDADVIAGHGSLGLEILEDVPDVDVVVVGIGGGGLISGVATPIRETRPGVRVVGVEPVASAAVSRAIEAGEVVRIQPASVADGLGAPFAGVLTLELCRRYLDGIVLVDDPTILAGMRFAAERLKQVLEPAGAAALAAVLFGRVAVRPDERVCVVASGGNANVARLGELLAGAAPLPA
jgi:threonine dehydratase